MSLGKVEVWRDETVPLHDSLFVANSGKKNPMDPIIFIFILEVHGDPKKVWDIDCICGYMWIPWVPNIATVKIESCQSRSLEDIYRVLKGASGTWCRCYCACRWVVLMQRSFPDLQVQPAVCWYAGAPQLISADLDIQEKHNFIPCLGGCSFGILLRRGFSADHWNQFIAFSCLFKLQ